MFQTIISSLKMMSISSVFNIILALFLFFQWFKNRAREESIKNNVFSARRMVAGLMEHNNDVKQKAKDITEILDATLATLGARLPFKKWREIIIERIRQRNRKEEQLPITEEKNENI